MKEVKFKDLAIGALFVTREEFQFNDTNRVLEKETQDKAVLLDLSKLLGDPDSFTFWTFDPEESVYPLDSLFKDKMEVVRNYYINSLTVSNFIINKINKKFR